MSRLHTLRTETAKKRYDHIDCRYRDRYQCHPVMDKIQLDCPICPYMLNNMAKLFAKICEVKVDE